jgi:surfeit locus 1 family protein
MGAAREGTSCSEYAGHGEVPPARSGTGTSRRFVVWGGGLLVAVLVPLFVSLGNWQWHKAAVKAERQATLDARAGEAPVLLPSTPVDAEAMRYRRVVVHGRFEPAHQILIDNRIHREQAGYHVVTPLRIEGSDLRVLVDRGWVPAGHSRAVLPSVDTPSGLVTLTATAVMPGTRFFTLGPQATRIDWRDAGARVWPNLDLARFRQAVDFPLQPVILQLDPDSPAGFVREWARPDERIERHVGYALQWYGFAVAVVAIWAYFLLLPWLRRLRGGGA